MPTQKTYIFFSNRNLASSYLTVVSESLCQRQRFGHTDPHCAPGRTFQGLHSLVQSGVLHAHVVDEDEPVSRHQAPVLLGYSARHQAADDDHRGRWVHRVLVVDTKEILPTRDRNLFVHGLVLFCKTRYSIINTFLSIQWQLAI